MVEKEAVGRLKNRFKMIDMKYDILKKKNPSKKRSYLCNGHNHNAIHFFLLHRTSTKEERDI